MRSTRSHPHAVHTGRLASGVDAELAEHPLGGAAPVEGVRALVEPEPVAVVGRGPPAEAAAGLVHHDREPGPGDEGGGGQPGQAGADDVDLVPRAHALSTRQADRM